MQRIQIDELRRKNARLKSQTGIADKSDADQILLLQKKNEELEEKYAHVAEELKKIQNAHTV